jgi:arginyl-tRNA synthetase
MKVFDELYKQLNVSFDYILGESFYSDKMQAVIDELKQKNLLEEDQGAQVVLLDNEGMIPCIIIKSDGTSIYATRDLAAAIYREETFHPGKMLYVVDKRQSLHFNQVFSVLGKMNREIASVSEHVSFGIMKVNGETGSTRQGKGLLLDEVLAEAISKAKETIVTNKNSQVAPEDVDKVAKQIGIASIVFNDLKHHPSHDIDFVIEEALSFEGKTGPYLQYTNARIQSLLEKSPGYSKDNADGLNANDEIIWDLVYHLNQYVNVLTESVKKNDPSQVARFLLELAQLFNRFYAKERVITENTAETNSKLLLCEKVSEYLKHGLSLLCIEAPSKL